MKKVLLFVAVLAAFNFTSCSDDEDGGGGSAAASRVKATIDGVPYTFDVVDVVEVPEDGYTDLYITASLEDNPDTYVTVKVAEGNVGEDAIWEFVYWPNGDAHTTLDGFTSNITTNDNSKIEGTFSGSVQLDDTSPIHVVTDGQININR